MRVLLATEGTKYGDAATAMVSRLRLGEGDEIRIVSVLDMAVPLSVDVYGGYIPETVEIEKAARENAEDIANTTLEKLRPDFPGVAFSIDVLFGSPDSRIVETAEEWQADLIVIGSHGYNAWERLLLGSISN